MVLRVLGLKQFPDVSTISRTLADAEEKDVVNARQMAQDMRRVYIVNHRVDFRRRHEGLLAESFKLGKDPIMGDLMIFIGRGKSRLKLLYADQTEQLWRSHTFAAAIPSAA